MAGRGVQELVEICQCSASRAEELLQEAGNDIETAIALHFARPTGLPTGPQSPRCVQFAAQIAPIAAARSLAGPTPTRLPDAHPPAGPLPAAGGDVD